MMGGGGNDREESMSTTVRITIEQFAEMIQRGDFDANARRIELIDGEIREMPVPNPPHEDKLRLMTEWSYDNIPRREVQIRGQSSIGLPALDSVPVPDLTWIRQADYSARRPLPQEVLLVVEVSDSTLSYDRNQKARLYAAAGIADYWIANIPGRCFEVRRDPEGATRRSVQTYRPGQDVRPLTFPDLALPVSLIFPD